MGRNRLNARRFGGPLLKLAMSFRAHLKTSE
jgi:hypothetical protein